MPQAMKKTHAAFDPFDRGREVKGLKQFFKDD
jgi:hypothetical protein